MKLGNVVIGMVAVGVCAGAAFGGTLKLKPGVKDLSLSDAVLKANYFIAEEADRKAILTMDEDAVVSACLKAKSWGLLTQVMGNTMPLSRGSMEKIKEAILSQKEPAFNMSSFPRAVVGLFPAAERGEFKAALEQAVVATPGMDMRVVAGERWVNDIVTGTGVTAPDRIAEAVRVLLAPDVMSMPEAGQIKDAIKQHVVRLGRLKLRAEGRSFVTKNNVNPLVEKVEPVVKALNAPECQGLEAALRALDVDIPDVDRSSLRKTIAPWQATIMTGDTDGQAYLGKISVVLGVEEYNRFVTEYNDGKVAVK